MTNYVHKHDIPENIVFEGDLAVDTEAMGLNNHRDRLCVVQISDGNGDAHLVHFEPDNYAAPNLKALLADKSRVKIFHFARFDVAIIYQYLGVLIDNVYCTKIASRLARTYTDQHGFKDLCGELLSVKISKQQQSSDWGKAKLADEQVKYAAADVLYLHRLRSELNAILEREGRIDYLQAAFDFLPTRARLDLAGWGGQPLFDH